MKNAVSSAKINDPFIFSIDGMIVDIDAGHWLKNSDKNIVPIYIDQIEYLDLGHNNVQRDLKVDKSENQTSEEACEMIRKVRFTNKKPDSEHASKK
jgi:hypothetical protein